MMVPLLDYTHNKMKKLSCPQCNQRISAKSSIPASGCIFVEFHSMSASQCYGSQSSTVASNYSYTLYGKSATVHNCTRKSSLIEK